jgi:hypothetical protein
MSNPYRTRKSVWILVIAIFAACCYWGPLSGTLMQWQKKRENASPPKPQFVTLELASKGSLEQVLQSVAVSESDVVFTVRYENSTETNTEVRCPPASPVGAVPWVSFHSDFAPRARSWDCSGRSGTVAVVPPGGVHEMSSTFALDPLFGLSFLLCWYDGGQYRVRLPGARGLSRREMAQQNCVIGPTP